ncbi:hypothetical protein JCM8547_005605 [Rhodosporidiobolus lusitaniae]
MASERLIEFADKSADPATLLQSSYQLLALPPALLSLLSSSDSSADSAPLEIRGDPSDSAVLVTPMQTYALRGVQNSNSLCVCATRRGRAEWFVPGGAAAGRDEQDGEMKEEDGPARKKRRVGDDILIEGILHETLEAVPGVARTEKLEGMLKGCEYTGEAAEEELVEVGKTNPRQKHTFASLQSRLPASDAEIHVALARLRVVTLASFLRPLPPSFLLSILPSIPLTLPLPAEIAHFATPPAAAPAKKKGKEVKPTVAAASSSASASTLLWAEANEADLLDALDAVDCGNEEVALQVLSWFGEKVEGAYRKRWKIDARKVVREVGIVLLADGGYGQQPLDPFLAKWKTTCGGFSPVCDLSLLAGLHLHRPPPVSTLQYLPPSSLSPDPAARFSELFALKPRWLEAEMLLFVDDLTGGDKKKRDALVLKFVRKVKEKGETWWSARNLWN